MAMRTSPVILTTASDRDGGGAFRLFESPGVVRRVGALLGRGKAHIGQCAAEVRRLNLAAQEAVDDRQVSGIARRILLEDPLAGVGAESVHAAVVREQPWR